MTPRVVIVGAGVVGAGLADELTERGWTDVTIVDQGPLPQPGGSSSHAPGLVFQTNPSQTLTEFASYTVEKFASLGSWAAVGGLEVATTPERLADLSRRHGWATSWGVESELVDPDRCAELHPLLGADRVLGGFWIPSDGLADAKGAVARQLARAAERGARPLDQHLVVDIETAGGRVTGVVAEHGAERVAIPADVVVACAGFWGPETGTMVGRPSPLQPMAHQYVRTTPLESLAGAVTDASAPILRHQDRDLYFREHGDRLGIGSYAHRPMPIDVARLDALPTTDMPSTLEFTADDFAQSWSDAVELLPALGASEVAAGMNGIFSFTADGMPLLGPHPSLEGYWTAEAVWVTHSAGVARAMARWLVEDDPGTDLHACEASRFDERQLTPEYVRERATTQFVEVYDIVHPLDPPGAPRRVRTSPFLGRHEELGAVLTERGGWERPLWFEANRSLSELSEVGERAGWAARNWSPIAVAEALATRDRVALYDMTPLTRLDVAGPGALEFLQAVTSNDVDRPVGAVVYTLLLSAGGGVLSDLTIARLGPDRFRVGANGPGDIDRLRRLAGGRLALDGRPHAASLTIEDVTDATCGVGLWGPAARDVLSALVDVDVSGGAFRYFTGRPLSVAGIDTLALRLSYVGELGWELYTAAEDGLALWDALWEAGEEHGILAGGRLAFDSLRIEKGYRATGVDLTARHRPDAAGLGFAVDLSAGDFLGRQALERAAAPPERLVPLLLDDPDVVVLGAEPVYAHGEPVGHVTSAAFGPSIHASIAYAWLRSDLCAAGTAVEVEYFGVRHGATVAVEPLFDPEMKRIRA